MVIPENHSIFLNMCLVDKQVFVVLNSRYAKGLWNIVKIGHIYC